MLKQIGGQIKQKNEYKCKRLWWGAKMRNKNKK